MTRAAAVAITAAALTAAPACGSQHAGGGGSQSSPRPSSLTIAVRTSPQGTAHRWTLTCDPVGGTLPGATAACTALARAAEPFAPVKRGVMCAMIYGGPQIATINGTWHGAIVHATFSRVNGCETKRWAGIAPVFGPYATPAAAVG